KRIILFIVGAYFKRSKIYPTVGKLYFLYTVLFGATVYVIIACYCIQVRQRSILHQLRTLEWQTSRSKSLATRVTPYFAHFLRHQKALVHLCKQLNAYSNFWTIFLTTIFSKYMLYQSYLSYAMVFVPTLPIHFRLLLEATVIETILLQFGLIEYCANVVRLNSAIGKVNRQLYFRFQSSKFSYHFKARNLLKVF